MEEEKSSPKRPDPGKLAALKSLPIEIVDSFSKEELHAFKTKRIYGGRIEPALGLFCFLFLPSCMPPYFRPVTPPTEPSRISES
jgi:hypothetical protein